MKNNRWAKQVEKVSFLFDESSVNEVVWADVVVKLLARQHAGFVRLVREIKSGKSLNGKRMPLTGACLEAYGEACDDLLAALTKRKGTP